MVLLFSARRRAFSSGARGVYVFSVLGDEPMLHGLARTLGFAVALASDAGYTYVLDRGFAAIRRIPSAF